ncbi:hypothetical protein K438DRAFT_57657 [Mycena galopus ATCC 62051]|nr:hypothetical protein K438DRAFT_57657 [Mycena galopus ATCC 62051]
MMDVCCLNLTQVRTRLRVLRKAFNPNESVMALRHSFARPIPLAPSLVSVSPRLAPPMSLQADETTASWTLNELDGSSIFETSAQKEDDKYKPWMYLPHPAAPHQYPPSRGPAPAIARFSHHAPRRTRKARCVVSRTLSYIFALTRLRCTVLLVSPAVKPKPMIHGALKVVHVPMAQREAAHALRRHVARRREAPRARDGRYRAARAYRPRCPARHETPAGAQVRHAQICDGEQVRVSLADELCWFVGGEGASGSSPALHEQWLRLRRRRCCRLRCPP